MERHLKFKTNVSIVSKEHSLTECKGITANFAYALCTDKRLSLDMESEVRKAIEVTEN